MQQNYFKIVLKNCKLEKYNFQIKILKILLQQYEIHIHSTGYCYFNGCPISLIVYNKSKILPKLKPVKYQTIFLNFQRKRCARVKKRQSLQMNND